MHALNTPEIIGKELFGKPGHANALRLEFLYNKIYGVIPTTLSFSDQLQLSCLQIISTQFERLRTSLSHTGDKLIEEGIWVGKPDTVYVGIFLSVAHGGNDGELNYYGDGISRLINASEVDKKSINLYVSVSAAFKEIEQAQVVIDLLAPYKLVRESKIYMLASMYGELQFTALPMKATETNLSLNYGEAFPEFHKNLVESLNTKPSGLYLFYGPPGTGKSSYIKHLLAGEINRKIAYIPVGMINQLVAPELLPLLMDNKNIVLVLEDAEKALVSRDVAENSAIVSTILNLTDGFIGQALNITIIATFNTDREKIDEALLRKGRLRMSYEFKKLNISDGKTLAASLGTNPDKIKGEMSLADIYNYEDSTGYEEPEEKRVGFF